MPSFLLPLILCVFTFSLYVAAMDKQLSFDSTTQPQTTTRSSLKGWHDRALKHPCDPDLFEPLRKNLKLALLLNGNGKRLHKGLSLAIFAEDGSLGSRYFIVDAMGRVLDLPSSSPDINGLLDFGRETLDSDLPIPETWGNTWVIQHQMTSQPIDRLIYVSGAEKWQTSVSGYSQHKKKLAFPVHGSDTLPDVLQELFGLVLEARNGYVRKDVNQGVISKVQEALSDL